MQPSHNAGSGSSSAHAPDEAHRLYEGADGVEAWEMIVPGWKDPTGWSKDSLRFHDIEEMAVGGRLVRFQLFELDGFTLGHTASLMAIQGMPLHQLFTGIFRHVTRGSSVVVREYVQGPWVFLRGELTPPWAVEAKISGLVLAKLWSSPPKEIFEQVLAALIAKIQTQRT